MRLIGIIFLSASFIYWAGAEDVVCSKKMRKVVTIGEGESFSFKTQAGAKYAAKSRCQVTYKTGPSCPSIQFKCSQFKLNSKKANCRGGDKMTVVADGKNKKYCKKSAPNVTTSKTLRVLFTSNKKTQASGAVCTAQCASTPATTSAPSPTGTSAAPTTAAPTTAAPTTAAPMTAAPTTAATTTVAPTTAAPTTAAPTTSAPTTAAPTTTAPTTASPTTAAPTTEAPTTAAPTTEAPTTATPTTGVPTTAAPTTAAPTTAAPTTAAPTTAAPTSADPTTAAPTTAAPTTAAPTTAAPTTAVPTTAAPSTFIVFNATCDNRMILYVDGNQVNTENDNDWQKTSSFILPAETRSIALSCQDVGYLEGFIASTDDGEITDSSWKCSAEVPASGWELPDYDDSMWTGADVIGPHGMRPWGMRPGISGEAMWIWAPGLPRGDATVYFRKTFA